MATTQQNLQDDQAAFNAAFGEEQAAPPEVSEDEAFGLMPERQEGAPASDESEGGDASADGGKPAAVALAVIPEEEIKGAAEQVAATDTSAAQADAANEGAGPAAEVAGEGGEQAAGGVDLEKETQRLKSWEGRLKKLEADLKAKGAASGEGAESTAAEAIEQAGEQAEANGNEDLGDAAEQVAEQVESGAMTPEQAIKQLTEDFGEDFVRMIEVIAASKAQEAGHKVIGEKVGELNRTVDEIIGDIVNTKARAHFEHIADAHPDFADIGQSAEFKSWLDSKPAGELEEAKRIVEGGSAREIVKLLNAYKADAKNSAEQDPAPAPQDQPDEASLDAAEGVRSSGMRLPEQPAPAGDFQAAWDEFK